MVVWPCGAHHIRNSWPWIYHKEAAAMILKTFFKGFKSGLHTFGQTINIIVNTILLTIVYWIGVGQTAIVAKLWKKRFLETELSGKSYWRDLDLEKKPIDEYYRQF